ncbi:MAG TPA: methylenetetrahydrofolate reductase C-terminal domain-containing protein [Acidobacteriota bacterium]|nr:methylenetetrahydrofolate reductase C-terminal domain-containing protein [Acidobacteriota bacterium]
MKSANRTRHVFVISRNADLVDLVRKAADETIVVDSAASEAEGRRKLGDIRPDIILIGNLDSKESAWRFYWDLREGWISHHASLLIIESDESNKTFRILGEENLTMSIGGHDFRSSPPAPFLPAERLIPLLGETIARNLKARENRFKNAMLDPDKFCLVWEQIPGPGAFEMRQETVLENARRAARSGKVCAISITDNPGGNPAIATDVLCAEILKACIEPLVHIAMRDKSRNQAESLLFQLTALEIHNVLMLTGDYPSNLGFKGKSKPVFDLDSVNGLRLVEEMNRGMEREIMRKTVRLAAGSFFAGVAFSPFKQMEAEVMGQYFKMQKKMEAGADFAITQVGYDARKLHEFLAWLKARDYRIPALAGIYVLSYPVGRTMHENNIPGCVVTDKLLHQLAAEAENRDKGKQARLDRAAKMFAIAKGMGYKGAYISGQNLPFESVEYIVERGNELAGSWMDLLPEFEYPQENGFYYFERDGATGLNTDKPAVRAQKPGRPAVYLLSRVFHASIFEPSSPLFKPMQRFMKFVDSARWRYKALHFFEHCSKSTLYSCKDCGDCALFDAAYLCPVSQCPKDQRNAPCGGSYQGWCEVYPAEKLCIWVRAYLRLKAQHREHEIGETIVPPCDWELWQTSSWVNYFLGRDHSSRQRGIAPPETMKVLVLKK